MIVYVPQTDEAAAAWLKWFVKYPNLRMVIAMSPRFQNIAKDPHLKLQIDALVKAGRLELALQIPNAPILPLLIDSSSAKEALPSGAELPNPAYAYPDDLIQLIARSKAGFFKQWNFLARGLVLPYGAVNPKLISLLERLGFAWVVGALEAPVVDGTYQSGPLLIWDATPAGKSAGTMVRVWDERQMKERPLDSWMMEAKTKGYAFLLPGDAGVQSVSLNTNIPYKSRTWMEPDWSSWIGQPAKNAGWDALRKTREALEAYKNSGRASVQRLDVAFEEIYSAQNSNYFASMGNSSVSQALAADREHEFQATLLAVYRVIGQTPPEDLFKATDTGLPASVRTSSTTVHVDSSANGREHILIEDALGDALVPGGPDLKSLEVWATTESIHWTATLVSTAAATLDIYVDLNGQPNAGTPSFLDGRNLVTSPNDAWEYALSMSGQMATLYRTQGTGTYGIVQTFPLIVNGTQWHVTVPRDMMRGSPKRWGYQVLVMSGDQGSASGKTVVSDLIDPLEISQKDLWQDISAGKRSDIPFVRVRSSKP